MKNQKLLLWITVVAVAVYTPLSVTYFLHGAYGHRLQDKFFAVLVSHDFAYGAGSGYPRYFEHFARALAEMVAHTIAGPVALIIGLLLLWPRLQRFSLRLHRVLGGVFVAATTVVCVSSAIFLTRVTGAEMFGGPSFFNLLWALCILTFVAMTLGVAAGIRRRSAEHSGLMLLAFVGLMSAPLLRFEWVAIAWVTGADKWHANAIATIVGPQIAFVAFYIVRGRNRSLVARRVTLRRERLAWWLGGFGTLICAAWALIRLGRADAWMVTTAVGTYLIGYVWFTLAARRAGEPSVWHVYRVGLIGAPAVMAAMLMFSRLIQGVLAVRRHAGGAGVGVGVGDVDHGVAGMPNLEAAQGSSGFSRRAAGCAGVGVGEDERGVRKLGLRSTDTTAVW